MQNKPDPMVFTSRVFTAEAGGSWEPQIQGGSLEEVLTWLQYTQRGKEYTAKCVFPVLADGEPPPTETDAAALENVLRRARFPVASNNWAKCLRQSLITSGDLRPPPREPTEEEKLRLAILRGKATKIETQQQKPRGWFYRSSGAAGGKGSPPPGASTRSGADFVSMLPTATKASGQDALMRKVIKNAAPDSTTAYFGAHQTNVLGVFEYLPRTLGIQEFGYFVCAVLLSDFIQSNDAFKNVKIKKWGSISSEEKSDFEIATDGGAFLGNLHQFIVNDVVSLCSNYLIDVGDKEVRQYKKFVPRVLLVYDAEDASNSDAASGSNADSDSDDDGPPPEPAPEPEGNPKKRGSKQVAVSSSEEESDDEGKSGGAPTERRFTKRARSNGAVPKGPSAYPEGSAARVRMSETISADENAASAAIFFKLPAATSGEDGSSRMAIDVLNIARIGSSGGTKKTHVLSEEIQTKTTALFKGFDVFTDQDDVKMDTSDFLNAMTTGISTGKIGKESVSLDYCEHEISMFQNWIGAKRNEIEALVQETIDDGESPANAKKRFGAHTAKLANFADAAKRLAKDIVQKNRLQTTEKVNEIKELKTKLADAEKKAKTARAAAVKATNDARAAEKTAKETKEAAKIAQAGKRKTGVGANQALVALKAKFTERETEANNAKNAAEAELETAQKNAAKAVKSLGDDIKRQKEANEKELKKKTTAYSKLEAKYSEVNDALKVARKNLQFAGVNSNQLRSQIKRKDNAASAAVEKLEKNKKADIKKLEDNKTALEGEIAGLDGQINSLVTKLAEAETSLAAQVAFTEAEIGDNVALSQRVENLEDELQGVTDERDAAGSRADEAEAESSSLAESLEGVLRSLERQKDRADDAESRGFIMTIENRNPDASRILVYVPAAVSTSSADRLSTLVVRAERLKFEDFPETDTEDGIAAKSLTLVKRLKRPINVLLNRSSGKLVDPKEDDETELMKLVFQQPSAWSSRVMQGSIAAAFGKSAAAAYWWTTTLVEVRQWIKINSPYFTAAVTVGTLMAGEYVRQKTLPDRLVSGIRAALAGEYVQRKTLPDRLISGIRAAFKRTLGY